MAEPLESLLSERRHLCCVVVGSLAIVVWDILLHIQADVRLLRKSGLHFPQVTYVISRFAAIGFFLSEAVLLLAPVGQHCTVLMTAVTAFCSMHYTSIGLLHLLRTRAIYLDRPWVVRFFFLLWLMSSGTSIGISPFLLQGHNTVGNTCMHTKLNVTLLQILISLNTLQGTCVVLATSSGLITLSSVNLELEGVRPIGLFQRLKFSLTARHVPSLSKSLLRHSQWYYLWLLGLNISSIVGIGLNPVPLAYRIAWVFVLHLLLHCRACTVFRSVGTAIYTVPDEIQLQDLPITFSRDPDRHLSHEMERRMSLQENEMRGEVVEASRER
ncbi:hypothetical protein L218DRAFT_731785 [Marasmius fiardii PR-910]|nr:hypothetical protein L218DRAFT_731785 [Marasmius fiardii PR-910]